MKLYTGTRLLDARRNGPHKEITFKHADKTVRVQAEEVFFALGRIPNVASLGLEKIGVELEYHRIRTNARMQTSLPHIYAAGDCTGLHEIVHIAIQQGEIAAHNISHPRKSREMDYRLLTEIIFTDPQIGVVGLTENQAHVSGIPYSVASYPFADHGKSMIMEARDGFVKLLADATTQERAALGAFRYQKNVAVLHRDTSVMPKSWRCWSSWVYTSDGDVEKPELSVTYWMNSLQNIPASMPLFVTLNPKAPLRPELVFDRHEFEHPLFDHAAIAAQPRLQALQGTRNTWYCGAYLRHGFHEDGLASAVHVARLLGAETPWRAPPPAVARPAAVHAPAGAKPLLGPAPAGAETA
jgi:hypothetical protein